MTSPAQTNDPFAHLHDEEYARAFDGNPATADTLMKVAAMSSTWRLTMAM